MDRIYQTSKSGWAICILILMFIFSPVLSAQADAHPGAIYVVAIVLPVFVLALNRGLIKQSKINLCAILLFLMSLVSSLVSEFGGFGLGDLSKYLVFVVFFISTSSVVLTPKQLQFSFKAYLYLSLCLAILIILSAFLGYPHIEATYSQGRYSIGITGFFKNPNYLTSFYNVAFFICCYILMSVKLNTKRKVFLYAIIALFLVSSFYTGTRAALLVELLVLISVPILMAKGKRLNKLILFVVIALAVVVYYWTTIVALFDLFVGSREMISDVGREEAWTYALKNVSQNPILGCGHKSWSQICKGTSYLEYLHNIFLELYLDQGIVGILIIFCLITTGYKRTNRNDQLFLTLLLFFSAFPMFFQNGLYEVNFWRFIIINRLMMNISEYYEGGVSSFLQSTYGNGVNLKIRS